MFELRKIEFEEVLYLYNALIIYDLDDLQAAQPQQPKRRQVYADQVDWFD